jgi:predicted component of type VI protein secretion system
MSSRQQNMPEEEESGIDELMRLSRQFTRQQEEHDKQERQRQEQGKKVKGVLQGLKDLNLSMALNQLKDVATPEVIQQVTALKNKSDTEDLRKMITSLVDELEKKLDGASGSKTEMTKLINSTRTLSILLDLYFSLQ